MKPTSRLDPRSITADEVTAVLATVERAFGSDPHPAEEAADRAVLNPARCLAVFDGAQPIASTAAFSLRLTVPGGETPVAGVTMVGVLPTYRRRGLLSALMQRQLTDLHDAPPGPGGEAIAALWASEAAIYGRYGYGLASRHTQISLRRGETAFATPVGVRGVRFLDVTGERRTLSAVYDAARRDSVGWLARDERWWTYRLRDPEYRRHGATALTAVCHDGDEGVDGYVLYATKSGEWGGDRLPDGVLRVREVAATNPTAYAALWRYLLDVDLIAEVVAEHRPLDEPLTHLLADPRRARTKVFDNLWVRLVDVGPALAQRSYRRPVDVVLDVRDARCGWNERRWRLSGDESGAVCEPSSDVAELTLDVADLGAAYLGGTPLSVLARAGRVRELRPGALRMISDAFGSDVAPYCPEVF